MYAVFYAVGEHIVLPGYGETYIESVQCARCFTMGNAFQGVGATVSVARCSGHTLHWGRTMYAVPQQRAIEGDRPYVLKQSTPWLTSRSLRCTVL